MEIKPLDSRVWTKVEEENYKEIIAKKKPESTPAMKAVLGEDDDQFIGCSEVAELLEITVDRVRYLSRLKRIPSFTLRDRGTRIYEKNKILELTKPF